MTTDECVISTPLGPARMAAQGDALLGLWFRGQKYEPPPAAAGGNAQNPSLQAAAMWLQQYFAAAKPQAMPLLRPRGTPFQQAVWQTLQQISSGKTLSYGAVARTLGHADSARAVAAAIGRNPISILIPCHRVLGADSKLTGYAGGIGRKRALLAIEAGAALPWRRVAKAYSPQYAEPIEVDVGEAVDFVDRPDDGEFVGWKWAQAQSGRGGWVPRAYFGPGDRQAIALRHYSARELKVGVADEVLELDQFSGWLWVIDRAGQFGWVPASCF